MGGHLGIIEKLDEDTSLRLLELKWIKPLIDGLHEIANYIISEHIRKIVALSEKYKTTFADVENEIESINGNLIELIDSITGCSADMEGLTEFRKILEV